MSGRRELLGALVVAELLGELAHEIVERRAQILRQHLDLVLAGAAFQRLLQRVLRRAQRLLDVGDTVVLDRHRERPHARHDLAQRIVGARCLELARQAVQAEICPVSCVNNSGAIISASSAA